MIEYAPKQYQLTYNQAFLYCLTLECQGHKDWQLPPREYPFSLKSPDADTCWWNEPSSNGHYRGQVLYFDVIPIRIKK